MKRCPACGQPASADDQVCTKCRAPLVATAPATEGAAVATAASSAAVWPPAQSQRPNGEGILQTAYVLGTLALLMLLLSWNMDVESYGELDGEKLAIRWWMLVGAGGLFQLGVIAWAVGRVVHALSFIGSEPSKVP